MDLSNVLSGAGHGHEGPDDLRRQSHQYPTRRGFSGPDAQQSAKAHSAPMSRMGRGSDGAAARSAYTRGSPAKKDQRHVLFQLIDPKDPRVQARLPMRVMISPHDTTESIITTVKNFYGLYEYGVSFENRHGISIIAAFDNFENDMTVYVRTVAQPPAPTSERARDSVSPTKASLGAPFEMRPPNLGANHSPSRSAARSAGVRSVSPQSELGRRSASTAPAAKPRVQRTKSKDQGSLGDADGYSSADNDNGSVTSSRRSKAEEIKAEITVDNIVEGGRRKRAFESSASLPPAMAPQSIVANTSFQELPLFVPPQVPMSASTSSISPQRRPGPMASPYAFSNQQTFAYQQPLPSPQSHGNNGHMRPPFPANPYQTAHQQPRQLRGNRPSYSSNRHSCGGVLPTPDSTIGSVISDEDVALQLMRLGDPTAFSHGRTSTSTLDDALSGKADAASSDEADESDEEDEPGLPAVSAFSTDEVGPARKKQRTMNELPSDGTSGEEYEDHRDGNFGSDDMVVDGPRKQSKVKSKSRIGAAPGQPAKSGRPRTLSISKPKKASVSSAKIPMSPASLPSQSRKGSVASVQFQNQLGADEEDLSCKPRCQRCRKSKKGCDRQRPCGRCKDAGIGIEGCISEDEGNGRKGRYGRHMGVAIKKVEEGMDEDGDSSTASLPQGASATTGYFIAPALPNKDKKRTR